MPHDLPPPDLGVFTCSHVLEEGKPILHVSHDAEGDWQVLCGLDHGGLPAETGRLVRLEQILARDPSLAPLLEKLACNGSASRSLPDEDWELRDHLEDAVRANIADFGWHVMLVRADAEGPGFAYSIGLYESFGQPEILIVGLGTETMHWMINEIGGRLKQGERVEAEGRIDWLLEGHDCAMRQVAPAHYRDYLGYARWYYRGDGFPVLQCAWPDKAGRFPWEPAFDPALRDRQPDLG